MYWNEFKKLILTHATHPNQIQFPKQDGGHHAPSDIQTIVDLGLPARRGLLHTGYSYDDYMRDSIVANGSWFNGEIPRRGWKGSNITDDRPARGWMQTLEILLDAGTIRPSAKLDKMLGRNTREMSPTWQRMNYIREVDCD